jgi:hypothetical protein
MRTMTCLFFAVTTLLLDGIRGAVRAGIGQGTDAVAVVAALAFLVAAATFAILDLRLLGSLGRTLVRPRDIPER